AHGRAESLCWKLDADLAFEIGNSCTGVRRIGSSRWFLLRRGARAVQHYADDQGDGKFVFHGATSVTAQAPRGNVNANVVPVVSLLLTWTRPPCCWEIRRTKLNPNPQPGIDSLRAGR